MVKTLPITEAREKLTNLVDKANKIWDEYIITVNGKPAAVLMSVDEYESWKETNEILADEKLMKAIRQGEKDIEEGKVYDWEEVKKELGINV
ncbi:MAG: type II toxin-antitoxin system Phd/YefM family antitoxin [Patescibacteria group bacterium]|nr:type II toxin-antitoxin system Phd/YefM family antitoxin [Patescibacteria group bacterium]